MSEPQPNTDPTATNEPAATNNPTNTPATTNERVEGIRKALVFYRVMAYIVGVLLVLLVLVGMPLKYLSPDPFLQQIGAAMNQYLGIGHGWLYAILLLSAYLLGRRVQWSWKWLLAIALAGTVPILSFVAERKATKDVKRRIATLDTDQH